MNTQNILLGIFSAILIVRTVMYVFSNKENYQQYKYWEFSSRIKSNDGNYGSDDSEQKYFRTLAYYVLLPLLGASVLYTGHIRYKNEEQKKILINNSLSLQAQLDSLKKNNK